MGLFDWFFKSGPRTNLPELCDRIAYKILPKYAFNDFEKLKAYYQSTPPSTIGPKFYAKACEKAKVDPVAADAEKFRASHGYWDGGREYFSLEYPAPKPNKVKKMTKRPQDVVVCPCLSVVVREPEGGKMRCFVLVQSTEGDTTLQEVTPDGKAEVGPGPEPRLSALLEAIAEQRPWRKE
jgi:hypothetical protein